VIVQSRDSFISYNNLTEMEQTSAEKSEENVTALSAPISSDEDEDEIYSLSDEGENDEFCYRSYSSFKIDFEDTDSQDSYISNGSLPVITGHYEGTSAANTDTTVSGRWIETNVLAEHPSHSLNGSENAGSSFAEFILHLTSLSRDIAKDGRGRFFEEKEYIRLDETLLCEVFALLVCLNLTVGSQGAEETPQMQFFTRQWAKTVFDLSDNLRSSAFSRQTFETTHGLKWVNHDFKCGS